MATLPCLCRILRLQYVGDPLSDADRKYLEIMFQVGCQGTSLRLYGQAATTEHYCI